MKNRLITAGPSSHVGFSRALMANFAPEGFDLVHMGIFAPEGFDLAHMGIGPAFVGISLARKVCHP